MTINSKPADETTPVTPAPAPQKPITSVVAIPGTVLDKSNVQYADETIIVRDDVAGRSQPDF